MTETDRKFRIFLGVASDLNQSLNIIPVLYGSLALNYLIGEIGPTSDIDILLPDQYITGKWRDLRTLMEKSGYTLVDEKEHEFKKDNDVVAYASEENLVDIPSFMPSDLRIFEVNGAKFKQLTPKNYLDLYTFLQTCEYRIKNGKDKKDKLKIAAIQRYLEQS